MTYKDCKYFLPSPIFASLAPRGTQMRPRKKKMAIKQLTYQVLLDDLERQVQYRHLNKFTAANRRTALRNLLRALNINEADVVGNELRPYFQKTLEEFSSWMRNQGRSERSISNARADIKPFRNAVIEFDELNAYENGQPTDFSKMVISILKGLTIKAVARESGIPENMLRGWAKGRRPLKSNFRYVHRFESFFGIEKGALISLVSTTQNFWKHPENPDVHKIEYRELQRERSMSMYRLKVPPDSSFREEWRNLIKYKTDPVPLLERSPGGRWTLSALPLARNRTVAWWLYLNNAEVPAAGACASSVFSYLGWLSIPAPAGPGIPECQTQTLAWFISSKYVQEYLEWLKVRAGDKHSRSVTTFLAIVTWLVRPGNGYLFQQTGFEYKLPNGTVQGTWEAACEKQYAFIQRYKTAVQSEVTVSRDPFDPIRSVIELKQPMEAVADMISRMRADRPTTSPLAEAIWARDILIIKFFVSNPLRLRNMASLTWSPNYINGYKPKDKCAIYKKTDGSWWVSVPKGLSKTRSKLNKQDYDAPLQESAWKDLERYLTVHRPLLLRWPSELLFIAKEPKAKNGTYQGRGNQEFVLTQGHTPFMAMSRRVSYLTRKYLWNSPGVGAHGMRHIVATSILKCDGGDIKTAALVLNDAEKTIFKHYSGMRSGDGNKKMGELLKKTFDRM
jgi:integrase